MVGGVTGRERISGLTHRSARADIQGQSRVVTLSRERTEGLAEGPVQAREAALIETKRDRTEVHLEHTTTATRTFDANQRALRQSLLHAADNEIDFQEPLMESVCRLT